MAPMRQFFIVTILPLLTAFPASQHSFAQPSHQIAISCTTISVGKIPINDLGAGLYQGFQGGLYPGGNNQRPASHESAGRGLVTQILPRNATGSVDTLNGKIVLLSIGMSNTTQEFSAFRNLANADSLKNPKLVIVDGAQGGQPASVISDSNANYWNVIDQRLANAGVTRQQVQAAWIKQANANPTQAFPAHARILDSQFVLISRILKSKYPNIRLAYWSSRIYAGYATTTLNPEPYAYESAFAVKWLIEKQINGDTSLTYSGSNPKSPWLAWGPYLWADGLVPRSDSLTWACADFQSDGTHPSTSGRLKVAAMLLGFFKSDATTKPWFLASQVTTIDGPSHVVPENFALDQNYPNPFNPTTTIVYRVPSREFIELKLYDVLGREVATLVNEVKGPGTYEVTWDATTVAPNSSGLASGVYFYRMQAGAFSQTKKLILLR